MSERMTPLSFPELMTRLLREYREEGSIFGVHQLYESEGPAASIFGESLETPVGPAAGPHTQMAQNILAAYAAGARFFEVKTVQKTDGEDMVKCIARPCILAEDEGYNVEWSTELTVPQAQAEYVKAWFAMKLISAEFSLGDPDGFIINMSVGYDLEGIRGAKVDAYIEGMKDASALDVWHECTEWTLANLQLFTQIDEAYVCAISPRVCNSITLSTLHGCPPDEIERIASYLIREKHLHTFIKCNPTLLGYDFARRTVDELGFDYLVFNEFHFENDLQYEDAVPMLRRLQALADAEGVSFGVKLTNTFPVKIAAGELPGEEMYMSGRSLFPLSLSLAARLEEDFGGKLRVSFSGGADAFNIRRLVACGIWPVTVATTLLKPGGYNRMRQIAFAAGVPEEWNGVDTEKLKTFAESVLSDEHHRKALKPEKRARADRKAPLTDCFIAGCSEACPIGQDIPAYLAAVAEGDYLRAMRIICCKNPLPHITGAICAHFCQRGCARNFYESAVHIRDMKYLAAKEGFDAYLSELETPVHNGPSVAVVGGGPGGMSAAFLAARAGAKVTLFEKTDALGGTVRHVIPAFRISDEDIGKDIRLMEKMGVTVRLNTAVTSAAELKGFDHVIVAVGAVKHSTLKLTEGEALNAIDFLTQAKKDPASLSLGRTVVVVGGGNTAMDAARAAKRIPGVEEVRIVYRRTVRQMPAEEDELALAGGDGVIFCELLSPVAHRGDTLTCEIMRLGEPGPDGRRSPEPTGMKAEIPADTVIAAIGEKNDLTALAKFGPAARIIGDARRGPATVVEAIADAAEAVAAILPGASPVRQETQPADAPDAGDCRFRRSMLCDECGSDDASRCLGCSTVCESCADVCPNRANVALRVNGRTQILHLDRLCNECGNCAAFCPYSGKPYRDKWTLFESPEAFEETTENQGFLPLTDGRLRVRLGAEVFEASPDDPRLAELKSFILEALRYIKQ